MAVAVPLLMSAAGVGTAVSIAVGVGMAVTGIGAKINKAASKVFGKGLVNAFNIIGTAYGIAGGFSGASPTQVWDNITSGNFFAGVGGSSAADAASSAPIAGAAPGDYGAFGSGMSETAAAGASGGGSGFGGVGVDPSVGSPATGALDAIRKGDGSAGEAISKTWKGMSPATQSAALTVGGQVLAGYSQQKAAEEQERMRREDEARYRSGSGLNSWAPGALQTYRSQYQNNYTQPIIPRPQPGG